MKFLFDDESFSFEALRAAGYATYAGAELGEVIETCLRIPEGDESAWSAQWAKTAERVEGIGKAALNAGHKVSAREALLRASNYYRTADFYRREDPAHDAESARLASASQGTFAQAAALLDVPARPVRIPYEGTTLPGYLFLADDSGDVRPTVIYHGGFDSTLEENYFGLAVGALRRGYHVLTFDGPGQGTALRDQGLHFRPDWEAVVTPVVDFATTCPEIDATQMVLVGTSLGGYFAARAAAFEPRLAACILHDGVYEAHSVFAKLPVAASGGADDVDAKTRWVIDNGQWTFGVESVRELIEASEPYTMENIAQQIDCPTLVLEAENDMFFRGQPEKIYEALSCPKDIISFPANEGGGEHCHEGALALWHQQAFDWLARTV
ncbi:alpha/beta fold hydrolase [Streptomyces sp. NPDC046985]|uniref:alpha/beta hydrolase family protein n=1 Tax=Streptomyces sp. NPDC046985 TaxID=3155377 RepID=UPI0033E3BF6D